MIVSIWFLFEKGPFCDACRHNWQLPRPLRLIDPRAENKTCLLVICDATRRNPNRNLDHLIRFSDTPSEFASMPSNYKEAWLHVTLPRFHYFQGFKLPGWNVRQQELHLPVFCHDFHPSLQCTDIPHPHATFLPSGFRSSRLLVPR